MKALRPKILRFLITLAVLCSLIAWAEASDTAPKTTVDRTSGTVVDFIPTADLKWLVGKWRCYSRTYQVPVSLPLGSQAEDSLDYFNVYLPFADDKLTGSLTGNPKDREIAAEFLVRYVSVVQKFEEQLSPMAPRGPIYISTNRIWVVESPLHVFEFQYKVELRAASLWLVLDSRGMHLELLKLTGDAGDLKGSSVVAPAKDYPAKRISELLKQYEKISTKSGRPSETNGAGM